MNKSLQLTLAALGVLACAAVQAQSAGDILVRAGALKITPVVTSSNLSPPAFANSQVDVLSDATLSGGISYMVTDQIALDLPLALPLKHNIVGAGSVAGTGKLGETQALPITLLAQYRWGEAKSQFRPYVGIGPTYAVFYKERGTNRLTGLSGGTPGQPTGLSIENRWGMTVQLGLSVALDERWFVDAALTKTWLNTRSHLLSTDRQTIDLRLNPRAVAVAVGYRF